MSGVYRAAVSITTHACPVFLPRTCDSSRLSTVPWRAARGWEDIVHIPDGYLSPQTSAVFGVAMLPLWWQSARQVKKVVKSRYVPLVALGAAFSFVVMMFNVPIPDGTTAHAVGGGLIAILLGP